MMDQKKRTLKRLGIAGVATAMTTMGIPALAGAATVRVAPNATTSSISAPGAPTGLTATDAGTGLVNLSWTAPSGTVSGYNVYASSVSGGESGTTPLNADVLVKGTTYTAKVPNSGTFYFEVAAVNAAGQGTLSSEASAAAVAVKPGAPSGVTATASANAVYVSWTAPSTGSNPSQYTVKYGTSSSSLTSQMTVGGKTTSAQINNLNNNVTYYFDVTATNIAGTGTASSTVSAVPGTSTVPPPPLNVRAQGGNGKIVVSWTPNNESANSVTGYEVYEGSASGKESSTPINVVIPKGTYTVTVPATNGTTEYFTVKAVNTQGMSVASNEAHGTATATVTTVSGAPGAPQSLAAKVVGPGAVKLTWSAPASSGSSMVKEYFVEEATTQAGLVKTAKATIVSPLTTGPNSTTATSAIVTGVSDSSKVYFGVYAENAASLRNTGAAASKPSTASTFATASANSTVIPQAPTITTVSTLHSAAVTSATYEYNKVSWKAPAYPVVSSSDKFQVLRDGVVVGTVAGATGTTSYDYIDAQSASNSKPATGTTYSYKVTEVTDNSGSATSGAVKIDTGSPVPGSPTSLSATRTSTANKITLSWSEPTDVGAGSLTYDVLENGSAVPGADVMAGPSGHSTSATVTGVPSTSSTSFTVEAQAHNGSTGGGDLGVPSGPSNAVLTNGAAIASSAAAPTNLQASATGNGSIKLLWNASSTTANTPPTHYEILSNTTGGSSNDFSSTGASRTSTEINTSTSYTATNLKADTTYYFEVKAEPAAATPVYSNVASATTTSTPVTSKAPGVPTGLKATDDAGLVDLSWTAPSNSGASPISGYEIFSNTSSSTAGATEVGSTSGTGTSAVLDNLGTKTIDLFVKAMNSSGSTSGFSAPVQVTPSTSTARPSAPSTPQVSVGYDSAYVVWTPPSSDGGSAITGYFVTAHLVNGKGKTVFVHGTNASISGLQGGGSYYFTVVAVNAIGGGTPSAPSSFVKISNRPLKVYVTPPPARVGAGDVTIRVTVNQPTARVQLWDEANGKNSFFSKAVMETNAIHYGNGVAEFVVHVDATNHFYVTVGGLKSNTVTATVMK